MITGRFSVWDILVFAPVATAVVQLLLPFVFGVRPAQLARRAGGFAMVSVAFICAALGLPWLAESVREELGYDGFLVTDSWIYTAVFAVVMAGLIVSAVVTEVRACRRDVGMRPVAEAELRVLRPLAAAAGQEGTGAAEWAVTAVDCAEEELRHGRGVQAVSLLHSAAATLCEAALAPEDGRAAAGARDRLLAAGPFVSGDPGLRSAA
jgi:hypothetical protein